MPSPHPTPLISEAPDIRRHASACYSVVIRGSPIGAAHQRLWRVQRLEVGYLGLGFWALSWRPSSAGGSCQKLSIDLGEGSTHDILVRVLPG
jgi:hypothetical protein